MKSLNTKTTYRFHLFISSIEGCIWYQDGRNCVLEFALLKDTLKFCLLVSMNVAY